MSHLSLQHFRLFVKITDPTIGFQFLNLFFRQPASVSHLAVPFHISHRTHSWNDGGYRGVAQDITQRCFHHLIQCNIEIGSDLLYAFVDLLLSVTLEVFATEITLFKCGGV
jgi:hypothetical protein